MTCAEIWSKVRTRALAGRRLATPIPAPGTTATASLPRATGGLPHRPRRPPHAPSVLRAAARTCHLLRDFRVDGAAQPTRRQPGSAGSRSARSRARVWPRARAPRIHAPAAGRPQRAAMSCSPRPRPPRAVPRSGRPALQPLRERLGSGDGVDHRLRRPRALATESVRRRPLLAVCGGVRGRRLVEQLRQRNARARRNPRAVDQGRRVARSEASSKCAGPLHRARSPLAARRSEGPAA